MACLAANMESHHSLTLASFRREPILTELSLSETSQAHLRRYLHQETHELDETQKIYFISFDCFEVPNHTLATFLRLCLRAGRPAAKPNSTGDLRARSTRRAPQSMRGARSGASLATCRGEISPFSWSRTSNRTRRLN